MQKSHLLVDWQCFKHSNKVRPFYTDDTFLNEGCVLILALLTYFCSNKIYQATLFKAACGSYYVDCSHQHFELTPQTRSREALFFTKRWLRRLLQVEASLTFTFLTRATSGHLFLIPARCQRCQRCVAGIIYFYE